MWGRLFWSVEGLPSTQPQRRYNFVSSGFGGEILNYAGNKLPEIRKVLSEGWSWLETRGRGNTISR
jgi:hypothetical protein